MSSSSRSTRSLPLRPSSWRDFSTSAATTTATTPTDNASDHASIRSLLKLSRQIEEDTKKAASIATPRPGSKSIKRRSLSPADNALWLDTHACEALANCIKGSKAELTILAEMLDLTTADVLLKLKGGVRELMDVARRVQEKVEMA